MNELFAEVERLHGGMRLNPLECALSEAQAFRGQVAALQAENAKLRRLAQQMYPIAKAHLQLGVKLGSTDTMSYDWALQMVELGIEVDGC